MPDAHHLEDPVRAPRKVQSDAKVTHFILVVKSHRIVSGVGRKTLKFPGQCWSWVNGTGVGK